VSLFLASQSPRRRDLLQQIGVPFRLLQVDVDESPLAGEDAAELVQRLAHLKASTGLQTLADGEAVVLGADTVVCIDDEILGKPRDGEEARIMLRRLSGRTHQVLSAVTVGRGDDIQTELSVSEVTFRHVADDEIFRYTATGETQGKAGAYAVQGLAAVFVSRLEGSYSGVVGLPLEKLFPLLQAFGVPYWQDLS